MNNIKKIVFLLILTFCALFALSAQVTVMPNDPVYTDIINWENLGIIRNVPPLRPYPLALITSFLEEVMECEYTDQAAKAYAHYERIYGKSVDVGFEVSDNFKNPKDNTDNPGSDKKFTNELDVYLKAAGDIKATDYLSVGINTNILVTTELEKDSRPAFDQKPYDAVNDTTDLKFAQAFLDMNATAAIGNDKIYFQGGISRNSFGPFNDSSLSLGPGAFHSGNASIVFRENKWTYTQAMFMLGATNDVGLRSSVKPNKFLMLHSIDFTPFKWLTMSYYENVVYGNRFDPIYMLPFVPYMVAQGIGSFGDNIQMGVTFKVRPINGFTWLTDVFVDDMAASDLVKLKFDTKLRFAAQTGFIYSPVDSIFDQISTDYTFVSPYMYTHEEFTDDTKTISVGSQGINYQNYTNNGVGMGSNLPPNSDRFAFKIKATPIKDLNITFSANMIRHSNITELLITKAPEEAVKYLGLPAGYLLTDGSVFNHPYSVGAYDYAWNHFMFMQSPTKMYVWQAGLDAGYTLPGQSFGKFTINMGYTFEYIKNHGVQNNILPGGGVYSADAAGMASAYDNWKSKLHNDVNHYFRVSFKYLYGL